MLVLNNWAQILICQKLYPLQRRWPYWGSIWKTLILQGEEDKKEEEKKESEEKEKQNSEEPLDKSVLDSFTEKLFPGNVILAYSLFRDCLIMHILELLVGADL